MVGFGVPGIGGERSWSHGMNVVGVEWGIAAGGNVRDRDQLF